MPKKLSPETIEQIDAAVAVTVDEALERANHTLVINGNRYHLEIKDNILMLRNEVVLDKLLPRINTSDISLCKAFPTAWLALLDEKYPLMDYWMHFLHTPKELALMRVTDWAAYLVIDDAFKYASKLVPAAKFVSLPTEAGVYQVEYINGVYKVIRKMKDTRQEVGEPDWRTKQRNANYKHQAISILFSGQEVNARCYGNTSLYMKKMEEVISIDDDELRAETSERNIATSTFKKNEYKINTYIQKLEDEGKTFKSAARTIKLANDVILEATDMIGRKFIIFDGKVGLNPFKVTKENLETWLNVSHKDPEYVIVEDTN